MNGAPSRTIIPIWLLPLIIGLVITGLTVVWSVNRAHEQESSIFNYRSQTHFLRLQQGMQQAANTLRDYSNLIASEFNPDNPHPLTLDELIGFTQAYQRSHPAITGLGWAQFVPPLAYNDLVEQIKSEAPEGLQYHFAPEATVEQPILPVIYSSQPLVPLGMNLSSHEKSHRLIQASIQDRQARAWIETTAPYETSAKNDADTANNMLYILQPVYNNQGTFAGIAFAAWNLHKLLETALKNEPVAGIDISLLMRWPENTQAIGVYQHQSRLGSNRLDTTQFLKKQRNWLFASLPFTFQAIATEHFYERSEISHHDAYLILIFGLLLTCLASRYTHRHSQFSQRLQREIKKQVIAIKQKETHFQHLMDIIPDAIGVHQHGQWIYVNPAAIKAFGANNEDDLLDTGVIERVHSDDRAEAIERIRQEIGQGKTAPLKETRLLRLDGSMFYAEVQGRPFSDSKGDPAILVIMRDISTKKQAEQELLRLKMAVSQADDAIFITDADGCILYANQAYLNIFSLTAKQCIGQYAAELRGGSHQDSVYQEIIHTLNQGQPIQKEIVFTDQHGENHTVWRKISPVMEDGNVAYHVCVDHDITEKRQMMSKMESTQRLESLGVMAGGIAHDFNNLLAAIMGNTGLIARKLENQSPIHTYIDRINLASGDAANLCRQMLAYAGSGHSDMQPIKINYIIQDMDKLITMTSGKQAQLEVQLSDHLPKMIGDAGKIKQLLVSLISNASEAIAGKNNGIIRLSTSLQTIDQHIAKQCLGAPEFTAGTYLCISVEDNGSGIEASVRERMFEPFFSTKFTGRGLGLAAVLGIVKTHGGGISVESQTSPKDGQIRTSFHVYLPIMAKKTQHNISESGIQTHKTEQPIRVLMIDDDAMIRDLSTEILNDAGIHVITAYDGNDGLEIFRQHQHEIDVVLLDLTMPGMSGKDCFAALKGIHNNIRIIICSGYSEGDTREQLADCNPAAYVHKPFHPDELIHCIRQTAQQEY